MTDKDIIDYFVKDGKIVPARTNINHLTNKVPEMKEYLENRYPDSESYCESITRILYGIDEKPTCHYCGKPLRYIGMHKLFGTWCDSKCQLKDKSFIDERSYVLRNKSAEEKEEIKKKGRQTRLDRYGDENYNNRAKAEETYMEKYGSANPLVGDKRKEWEARIFAETGKRAVVNPKKTAETKLARYGDSGYSNKEKRLKTMMERYGGEYTLTSKELKAKVMQTNKEKYGDEHYINREKAKETMLERYGVVNPWQIPDVRARVDYEKIVETKIKNGTINTSKTEKQLYNILSELYGSDNVIKEYKDKRYKNPKTGRMWHCDFYIKQIDLFIELQGHYTHGPHPFNPTSEEDLLLKENIESNVCPERPSYARILDIWCNADVIKRNVAKENKLKYLEIFDLNFTMDDIKNMIKKVVEHG